jgi:hypothetical protein
VQNGSGRLEVTLRPAARDGAPRRFEVWVEPDGSRAGRVFRDGTRWATTPDGSVLIRGEPQSAIHTHGGEGAKIGAANFVAYNRGTSAVTITLAEVRWSSPGGLRQLSGVRLMDERWTKVTTLAVPAGRQSKLGVSFPAQEAYQNFGDHFEVEAEFQVGGGLLRPAVEIRVSRVTPRHS